MNDQQQLEENIACAKLLGYDVNIPSTLKYNKCMVEMHYLKIREFNIFTNVSQCLEVVKKLGVFGIDSRSKPLYDMTDWAYCHTNGSGYKRWFSQIYEEADAAIEVMK